MEQGREVLPLMASYIDRFERSTLVGPLPAVGGQHAVRGGETKTRAPKSRPSVRFPPSKSYLSPLLVSFRLVGRIWIFVQDNNGDVVVSERRRF